VGAESIISLHPMGSLMTMSDSLRGCPASQIACSRREAVTQNAGRSTQQLTVLSTRISTHEPTIALLRIHRSSNSDCLPRGALRRVLPRCPAAASLGVVGALDVPGKGSEWRVRSSVDVTGRPWRWRATPRRNPHAPRTSSPSSHCRSGGCRYLGPSSHCP
jgi:hypothetical protein